MVRIAVVGAGAVGLSTAINILDLLPNASVTVIADKFGGDTTSSGAGGLFRPTRQYTPGVPEPLLRQWCRDSWQHFSTLALSTQAGDSGTSVVSGMVFYNNQPDVFYKDFIFSYRPMTDKEKEALNPNYKHGFFATSIISEMTKYLPWLMDQFLRKGGNVEQRKLTSLNELVGRFDVVANCSGLEARSLVGDNSVYPVQGQLLKVKAPWIKHWYFTEDDTYFIPWSDVIIVGGTRQVGREGTTVDLQDSKEIWDRAVKHFPQIKGGTIEGVWSGLRPTREPIRVELERKKLDGHILQVVHNYGHGGNGISLSWGTAVHAAQLVKTAVESSAKSKL